MQDKVIAPVTPVKNTSTLPNLNATPVVPDATEANISPFIPVSKKRKLILNPEVAEQLLNEAKKLDSGFHKVLQLYKQSAEAGNPEAMARLGEIYLSGEGVKKNFETAYNYFEKSAAKGCPEGMYGLANYLIIHGSDYFESTEECLEKAADLYFKAAQKNYVPSIYKYGYCGLYGLGVDKDLNGAFHLISRAADLGYPEAIFELANCYYNAWGVKQDAKKAISLYKKAGELGCSEAYINLGRFYDAKNDVARAVQNFTKALELGNENARLMLQIMKLNRDLTNEQMDMLASTALQTSVSSTGTAQVIVRSPLLQKVVSNNKPTSRSATL
jgi:uncharacterized protein